MYDLNIYEALQGGFGEQGEWGQNCQGVRSMVSKKPGSREQNKLIQGAGSMVKKAKEQGQKAGRLANKCWSTFFMSEENT